MSRRRKAVIAVASAVAVALGASVMLLLPLFVGPAIPAEATRLHIATSTAPLTFGCATALLSPVRVASSDDELIVLSVESGAPVKLVWPSGFAAWRIGGQSVLTDPWGHIVGRDGDVLDSLGGGMGTDDAFHVCPFGIVTKP
jgi:hypothetical protein